MLKAAQQRTRHLAPGDKLGKYEVIRQIAIGGMAELYLARTVGLEGFEKLVVIKRILPQYVTNAAFVEMFLDEARLAATLHHTNVAQVYDIGVEDGDYFFAMEYVHGEDLDHIQVAAEEQGVPLSLDAALTLVSGLCAGLHYAHDKANAIHRDVSPSNVLVSYDGAVKLVDFGIARLASRPGTTEGGLKGKISYMSPEQCRSHAQLDRRSDLYSVGTILYQLTTGQLPFKGETEYQILHQLVNEDAPPPTTIVPSYPPQLERIVLRALARDPDQRYATALELQADVEDFAHETRLRVSPLVLARLMGTLFPARLEEWDHAKTQGGFFLEQHVVQTLIESGKTADAAPAHDVPADMAPEEAALRAIEHASRAFADDDATALSPQFQEPADTRIDAPPLPPIGDVTNPAPSHAVATPRDSTPAIAGQPDGRTPTPYPVVTELMSATPGALVTAAGKYGGMPTSAAGKQADPTERVRLRPKRASSPTTFVRGTSKKPIVAMVGLLVAGGAVAAVIALRPTDKPVAPAAGETSSTVEMKSVPAAPVEPAPAPTPPPEEALADPSPAVPARPTKLRESPKPSAKPVRAAAAKQASAAEPRTPAPKKPAAVKPRAETRKSGPKKAAPKKPASKEQRWNADSPFMPVRTNKK